MSKRRVTYRAKSPEIQGEGSWVELSFITRGEAKDAKGEEWADEMLKNHVIAWNWVDKDGNEMDVANLDTLFQHEREFIIGKLFNPDKEEIKNSETG